MTIAQESTIAPSTQFGLGGSVQHFLWSYQGQTFPIAYETLGYVMQLVPQQPSP